MINKPRFIRNILNRNEDRIQNETALSDTAALDAYGRQRVSNPTTIFDSQLEYSKNTTLWNEKTVGTASATHLSNESAIEMSVGTGSGDRTVRQTIEYIRYQPGKSQAIKLTGFLGPQKTGVISYIGYGDDDDGLFFGRDENGVFVLLRDSTSGSVDESRKFYQSDWNVDTFDGKGPSGVELNPENAQIFWIDFEWLSIGRVRMGFVICGVIYYCHTFDNANEIKSAYMRTANLPVRYEIKNLSSTSSSSTMKQICSEVESEGGVEETIAYPYSLIATNVSVLQNTPQIVSLFRLTGTFNGKTNRGIVRPRSYELLATSNTIVSEVIYEPTLSTTPTWNYVDQDVSLMEYATDVGNNYSGGRPFDPAITSAGGGNKAGTPKESGITGKLPIGLDIDGNADSSTLIGLVCYSIGGDATADITFEWEELY